MAKKTFKAYEPGTPVFGLSRWHNNGKPTDHVAIYPAKVKTVYIERNTRTGEIEIDYWLMTPEGDDWGDSVKGTDVADTVEKLVERMMPEWELNWKED